MSAFDSRKPRSSRRIIWIAAIILAIAVAWHFLHGGKKDDGKKQAGAPEVTVITVHSGPVNYETSMPGRTSAFRISEVRPQVNGVIVKRYFKEGGDVKAGTQLYQIDAAPYQAAFNSAQAALQKAIANARTAAAKAARYAELVKIDAVSRQDYDDVRAANEQARADVAVAKASLETAKVNLDYTRVFAPITGRIGKSNVTEGALVSASQADPLATITQLDPIYVDLTQSNKDLLQLREQTAAVKDIPVSLFLDDTGKDYDHEGKIQFSEVTLDPTTGSVQMRALFANPEHLLLPGLFVRAKLNIPAGQGLLVPQQAAPRGGDGKAAVWIVGPDNKVQPSPITTLRASGTNWLVSDGVKDGDTIVMEGFQKIQPGVEVHPTPFGEKPATPQEAAPPKDDGKK